MRLVGEKKTPRFFCKGRGTKLRQGWVSERQTFLGLGLCKRIDH